MKLSEAIRLGSMLGPQCFNVLQVEGLNGVTASCAMGAAKLAGFNINTLSTRFRTVRCLECHILLSSSISEKLTMIVHLNDVHKWSRERIADWVELNYEAIQENTLEKEGETNNVAVATR